MSKLHRNCTGRHCTIQAPELLRSVDGRSHFESDIYAFACVGYEILTDKSPFFEIKNDIQLALRVLGGLRPSRPETVSVEDGLWLLLQDCWNEEPTKRPGSPRLLNDYALLPLERKKHRLPQTGTRNSVPNFAVCKIGQYYRLLRGLSKCSLDTNVGAY
ncbi:hypothetical protein K438DRAFT_418296 [Mycena galopus ATCC 62051]|nr:hypothetical protein K438DRAFT_418296 [Mycena galopus ATCC 62051]